MQLAGRVSNEQCCSRRAICQPISVRLSLERVIAWVYWRSEAASYGPPLYTERIDVQSSDIQRFLGSPPGMQPVGSARSTFSWKATTPRPPCGAWHSTRAKGYAGRCGAWQLIVELLREADRTLARVCQSYMPKVNGVSLKDMQNGVG